MTLPRAVYGPLLCLWLLAAVAFGVSGHKPAKRHPSVNRPTVLLQEMSTQRTMMPSQCKALEEVHGASLLNRFLVETGQILPNKTITDICVSATDCKRLLRPLITPDGQLRKQCPNDCSGNGICAGGYCACSAGYEGLDCSKMRCANNCTGNGICKLGACHCFPGYTGSSCQTIVDCARANGGKPCSGHGQCKYGKCFCDPGFTNEACSEIAACPADCSNRGFCQHGVCFCPPGYGGPDCATLLEDKQCLNNCKGKGECRHGRCHCDKGHYGKDCSLTIQCPLGVQDLQCSGHGHCDSGHCHCDQGWTGHACSLQMACPGNGTCSGKGVCYRGKCFCQAGFSGDACDRPEPCNGGAGCSNHGVCVNRRCHCLAGYYGEDCSKGMGPRSQQTSLNASAVQQSGAVKTSKPTPAKAQCVLNEVRVEELRRGGQGCKNGCSGVGACLNGTCACLAGFAGPDCSTKVMELPCPNDCSKRGCCVFGKCHCLPLYKGFDCSESINPPPNPHECPKNCSGHGQCVNKEKLPVCTCDPGFAGPACDQEVPCPNNCHGRGTCSRGKCFCWPGFTGGDCSKPAVCPEGCNNKGLCFYGKCFCEPYYGGETCSKPIACAQGCNLETGICLGNDMCACAPGYSGVDCSLKLQCPNDCTSPKHGHCIATQTGAKCVCRRDWMGDDCSKNIHDCPSGCNGRGACVAGQCLCKSGYAGPGCEKKVGGGSLFDLLNGGMGETDTGGKGGTRDEPEAPAVAPSPENLNTNKGAPSPSFKPGETKSSPQEGSNSGAGKASEADIARFRESLGTKASASQAVKRMAAASVSSALRFRAVAGTNVGTGTCPNDCNKHGVCANSMCFCDPGFEGDDCAKEIACPKDCSDRGICKYGMCYCDPSYTGDGCEFKAAVARPFSQTWITVIIASLTFLIGLIVGRKTVAQAGLRFANKMGGVQQPLKTPA